MPSDLMIWLISRRVTRTSSLGFAGLDLPEPFVDASVFAVLDSLPAFFVGDSARVTVFMLRRTNPSQTSINSPVVSPIRLEYFTRVSGILLGG